MDKGLPGTRFNHLRVGDPFTGIHWGKLPVAGIDDARVILAQEAESATHTDNVHGLPVAIEDQYPVAGNPGNGICTDAAFVHGCAVGRCHQKCPRQGQCQRQSLSLEAFVAQVSPHPEQMWESMSFSICTADKMF